MIVAFDPTTKLSVDNATSLAELEAKFGDVGLENGPRVGAGRRSTSSNEAYLARRLILHLVASERISFPISIEHRDAPDFCIWHGAGVIALEVTESCPAEIGAKLAQESDEGFHTIGDYSNSEPARAWEDLKIEVQAAVDRKRCKPYAQDGSLTLLIYPNSEASQWVRLFERNAVPDCFRQLLLAPLKAAYVLWGETIVELKEAH